MKAVIVDLRGRYAAALAENGAVLKIKNMKYDIGQEVSLYRADSARTPSAGRLIKKVCSAAAAAAVICTAGAAAAYAMPYGTVSLEAEPSIQYTINCFDYVLDVSATGEEGETVLSSLDTGSLRHRRVSEAVGATLEFMKEQEEPGDAPVQVRVMAETRSEDHTAKLQRELDGMVPPAPCPPEDVPPAPADSGSVPPADSDLPPAPEQNFGDLPPGEDLTDPVLPSDPAPEQSAG